MKSYLVDGVRIGYLGEYHPYDQGTNSSFDQYSRSVLDIKDGRPGSELPFAQPLAAHTQLLAPHAVLTYYPSSKAGKEKKGLAGLIRLVAREDDEVFPDLLIRTRTVDKRATGGDRSLEVQLGSIEVSKPASIRGKLVVVVDDVVTTGTSLVAARQLLLKAGAGDVVQIALARTTR